MSTHGHDPEAAVASLRGQGVKAVRLLYTDLHGIARGKDIPIGHFVELLEDGVGGGAVGVPLAVILGAHGLAGRRVPARVASATVFVAVLVVWAVTATAVGGPDFALTTPIGLWTSLLYYGLLVTAALATSVPLRKPAQDQTSARLGSARSAATSAR